MTGFHTTITVPSGVRPSLVELAVENVRKSLTNLRVGLQDLVVDGLPDGKIRVRFRLDVDLEFEAAVLDAAMYEIENVAEATLGAGAEVDPIFPIGVSPSVVRQSVPK